MYAKYGSTVFFDVRLMFKISEDQTPEKRLVIIQCDSGHLNGDLIACARYRIYDLRAKADDKQTTHVLFIIHLPHHVANSSFVGFQGDPWISSHIDDLRPTSDNAVSANEAIGLTISELFLGRPKAPILPARMPLSSDEDMVQAFHEETLPSRSPLFRRLHSSIQAAASRLKDSSTKRSTKRVEILVHLIPKEPPKILG